MALSKSSSSKKASTRLSSFSKNYRSWILIIPSILLFYLIIWRPIGRGMYLSFFKLENYNPIEFIGLKNYRDVLSDTLFIKTLGNTVKYVGYSLLFGYLLPVVVAILLNEIVHFKSFFKFAIYFPVIVPSVAAALMWYFMLQPNESGILNMVLQALGLPMHQWLQDPKLTIPVIVASMTWRGFGASMLMYLATLQGVNQELYEAARIDGAGFFTKIRAVLLPHIMPIMLLLLVRQIISVFQVMVEPMTMTGGGPNNASMSLSLQGFYYAFNYFQPEKALSLGVITFIVLMIATIFYFFLNNKVNSED